jgi:hypothetical protein
MMMSWPYLNCTASSPRGVYYVVEWLEQHISAGTFNKKWQASASSGIDEWTYLEVSDAPLLHGDYDA